MSYYIYSGAPVKITSWASADAWINGGRNKQSHRKISKHRLLRRNPDGSISLQLWATDIVTYLVDGTFLIRHDGHTTVTTGNDLSRHCPAVRIVSVPGTSPGKLGETDQWGRPSRQRFCKVWEVAHESDKRRPAKVQKCRTCHGTGEGSWYCYGVNKHFEYVDHSEGTRLEFTGQIDACQHGELDYHTVEGCRRCDGTGRADYGSAQIHHPFGNEDVLHIAADGRVISAIEDWAALVSSVRQLRSRLAS